MRLLLAFLEFSPFLFLGAFVIRAAVMRFSSNPAEAKAELEKSKTLEQSLPALVALIPAARKASPSFAAMLEQTALFAKELAELEESGFHQKELLEKTKRDLQKFIANSVAMSLDPLWALGQRANPENQALFEQSSRELMRILGEIQKSFEDEARLTLQCAIEYYKQK